MDERRRAYRHSLQLPVELTLRGDALEADILNVSTGGLMIDFKGREPRVGDELEARFSLPGLEERITAGVIVRWVDSIRTEIAGVEFTTGLRAREVYAITQLGKDS